MGPCNLSRPEPVGLRDEPRDLVDALEDRILAHVPRLRAFLRRLSGSAQDAEDLVQDTLERSLRYRHTFDGGGSLPGWLMKTAFRCYLDLRDRRCREPRCLENADLVIGTRSSSVEARDLVGHLLQRLSPIEQDIVLRFHHRRETLAEIAQGLSIPLNTVKSHLHRARRKLAEAPE